MGGGARAARAGRCRAGGGDAAGPPSPERQSPGGVAGAAVAERQRRRSALSAGAARRPSRTADRRSRPPERRPADDAAGGRPRPWSRPGTTCGLARQPPSGACLARGSPPRRADAHRGRRPGRRRRGHRRWRRRLPAPPLGHDRRHAAGRGRRADRGDRDGRPRRDRRRRRGGGGPGDAAAARRPGVGTIPHRRRVVETKATGTVRFTSCDCSRGHQVAGQRRDESSTVHSER
jgi:hypothetical protein